MKLSCKGSVLLTGAALFVMSGALAVAQKNDDAGNFNGTGTPKAGDTRFAREAAMGGMMEVDLGKLAVQKASSDRVKQFGQRMVDDHSKAGDDLKGIAAKDNLILPSELDARHKAIVDRFSNLSGTAFDRVYMRDMVKDHQTDVADFQREANSGSNADLKTFATKTLPTLQEHLRIARETDDSLGATSRK